MSLIDDDIVLLIVKHISHDDTDDDRSTLDKWAHRSAFNRAFVEQHINEAFIAGRLNLYRQFDIEKGWKNVISKSKHLKTTKMGSMKVRGYAVALVIIAAAAYLYFKKDESKQLPAVRKEIAATSSGNQTTMFTVQPGYIATPNGRQYHTTLPDGSKVWLNAASSLKFPAVLNESERTAKLTGEAYFEIAPDSKRPFYVNISDAKIEVSGRGFNARSYEDENAEIITLADGTARITTATSEANMKAGQQARIANASGNINILVQDTDTSAAFAWKNGDFSFDRADLRTVLKEVSRWYDVEIVYERPPSRNDIFTGMISRSRTLDKVMSFMERSGIKYRIDGKKLIIK